MNNEEKNTGNKPAETGEEKPAYTPASQKKRIAAWIGVIAMVILVLLYTYSIATGAFMKW